MKAGIVAASLLSLAAAQPHHGHAAAHKRQAVVQTSVAVVEAPPVVDYVCVDDSGAKIACPADAGAAPAPAAPAPVPYVQSSAAAPASQAPAPAQYGGSSTPAPAAPQAPTTGGAGSSVGGSQPTTGSGSAPAPGSTGGAGSGSVNKPTSGLGVAYSPYNSDGSCKTAAEVMSDFDAIKGYSTVRIYNYDCNQISTVSAAARAHGMDVFAGLYKIDNLDHDLKQITDAFAGNYDHVSMISIGNEIVNSNQGSIAQVVAAVNAARPVLRAAGFQGPVVTVDTNNVVLQQDTQMQLCGASDLCVFNAHPFFAPAPAESAGQWALDTVGAAKKALAANGQAGKEVIIAECGWPSAGDANGPAIPSPENQKTAVAAISAAFSTNMYLFTAYNDHWKQPGAFNTEQWWGIMGNSNQ